MSKSQRMLTESVALDLIERIYAAAEAPELWPDFLGALASSIGASLTTFIVQDTRKQQGLLSSAVNCDPDFVRLYDEHYCHKNLWMIRGSHLIKPGVIVTSNMLCPDDVMIKSDFYNEYLAPQDVYEQMGSLLVADGDRLAAITTMRSRRQGPFEPEKERLLQLLSPHIRRAVLLHDRLQSMMAEVDSFDSALDRTTLGVVFFDAAGLVTRTNDAARRILSARDGLTIVNGDLRASRSDEMSQLRAMITAAAAATRTLSAETRDLIKISRPSLRTSYEVMVTALPPRRSIVGGSNAAVVMFITDPERPLDLDAAALQRLYGLTKAEARLTAMMAGGKSLDECATTNRISRETARTHLKHVFSKTDTSNRAELMLRLASSVAAATARAN